MGQRRHGVPGSRLWRRLTRRAFARGVTRWSCITNFECKTVTTVNHDGSVTSGRYSMRDAARVLPRLSDLCELEDNTTIRAIAAQAIFGTDNHVCDQPPDARRTFDIVFPPHTREKLNTLEPTFPLGLPVCLLHLGVVCKPVQIFPCMGCLYGFRLHQNPSHPSSRSSVPTGTSHEQRRTMRHRDV
jgi:hypothetical protein